MGEDESHGEIDGGTTLWQAVRTIAIADAVMSLDNVIAIAAASRGHPQLFIFGLLLSIPLIIMGAQFLTSIITRYPILIWLGAALLGWIAAEMILGDIAVLRWLEVNMPTWIKPVPADVSAIGIAPANMPHYVSSVIGAALVCAIAYVLKRKHAGAAG
jgi:predicted tellurium resistance membrane protein TerC